VGSSTQFASNSWISLNRNGVYEICAAIVKENTNDVLFGPVCLRP
jgi:hypothetical protein